MATFLDLQERYLYLIGETDVSTITDIAKSHLNYSIKDILNAFPFSWNLKSADLTLSSGTADLPTDFNPHWGIYDARIVNSNSNDDNIFDLIDLKERDEYGSTDYIYWITNDSGTYSFNTPVQSGTVTIYYYYIPDNLSGNDEICIVPDGEAVAYLAAAKNWIGDERNQQLKTDYEQEASIRIQSMHNHDLNFGSKTYEKSKVVDNSQLTTRGN